MAGLYDEEFVARLSAAVTDLLPLWGLPEGSEVRLLALSENATFLARPPADGRPVVIRVHRPDYHSRAEIESELAWLAALKQDCPVQIPGIIPALSGERIISFTDQGQTRFVVASEFLEGVEPDPSAALIPGFRVLGATSAHLHNHARGWSRPAWFTRKSWDYEGAFGAAPIWGNWRDAIALTAEGAAVLEQAELQLKSRLAGYGQDPSRFGVIHSDLRLANLLMRDQEIAVIDFDDTGFSWFLYDLASALTFYELDPVVPALITAWIEGYRDVAPLSADEIAMIPSFIMYRRFAISAWIATHAETETARLAGHGHHTNETVEYARLYLAHEAKDGGDIFALWQNRE